jgi:hypothetical protein
LSFQNFDRRFSAHTSLDLSIGERQA